MDGLKNASQVEGGEQFGLFFYKWENKGEVIAYYKSLKLFLFVLA
jgi:hypothetical protein